MAIRKTANKTSSKAKLNLAVDEKKLKRSSKKVNKHIKKVSASAILIAIFLLIGGALGGYFAIQPLMKNDCFELVGKDEITLTVGETYKDEGVKVIAFGRDEKDKVIVNSNMEKDENGNYTSKEEGTFYLEYTVDNIKYGSVFKIKKIRLVTFVEESEQEEIDSANEGGNE